jgi:hypothetical protein
VDEVRKSPVLDSDAVRRIMEEAGDRVESSSGMLSDENVDPALLVLVRPQAVRFCQDVGGSDERAF